MAMTNRIRVKICGMTQVAQVEQLVELGVDAIGMILHADSPRLITLKQAQQIRAVVPAFVSLVGVVVDCRASIIGRLVAEVGLDLVQLHGNESTQFAESLGVPYVKAIRARSAEQVSKEVAQFSSARAILIDPYVKGLPGGTGKQLDNSLWPKQCSNKLVLAGGLSADNICSMVDQFKPFAVDLNSGVERSPGVKDINQVQSVLSQLKL